MSTEAAPPPEVQAAEHGVPESAEIDEPTTLAGFVSRWWSNVRGGDLGSLPIVFGIIAIAIYFQYRNDQFLTAGNFVNLLGQLAPFAVIGMGIVFVLLLGEIDLSVGFVSGVGGVIVALLLQPDGNEVSTPVAIILGLSAGLTIGLIQGTLFAKVGIPSFVVTLAGLLAWNGVVLLLIGDAGTVTIQNAFVNGIANDFLPHGTAWLVLEGAVALYALIQILAARRRAKAGLPHAPASI
mgnify:FL=1